MYDATLPLNKGQGISIRNTEKGGLLCVPKPKPQTQIKEEYQCMLTKTLFRE